MSELRRGQPFDWVLLGIAHVFVTMCLTHTVSAAASGHVSRSDIVRRATTASRLCARLAPGASVWAAVAPVVPRVGRSFSSLQQQHGTSLICKMTVRMLL